jgi:8-oxo-dGTP diphosphatase
MPPTDVAAGLVYREGKLLITRRHADAHLGGLWEFPGGKREANESFEECLVRELREELVVGELIETITHEYPDKTVCLRFFRCGWKQGEPRPLGCAEFQWVNAKELRNYEFPAADERLLRKLVITDHSSETTELNGSTATTCIFAKNL